MPRELILCERPDHVTRARSQAPQAQIVAVTPESAWACQEQRIDYLRLDDWCAGDRMNQFAESLQRQQYAWAHWLDRTLGTPVPSFGEFGFAPTRAQLFPLKQALDRFIRPAYILREAARIAKPDRLIVFERPPPPDCVGTLPTRPERPLFGLIAPSMLRDLLAVDVWPDQPPAIASFQAERRWSSIRQWLHAYRAWEVGPVRQLIVFCRNLLARRARVAWVGSSGYDLAFAIRSLQQRGVAMVRPPSLARLSAPYDAERVRMERCLRDQWRFLVTQPEFWAPLDAGHPALRPFAASLLQRWVCREIPDMWVQFLGACAWLQQGKFDALVGMELPSRTVGMFCLAARSIGLPSVLAIHNGGFTIDMPPQDAVGPIQCDTYLTYCREDIAYYEGFTERMGVFPRARIVPVGSARLEALRRTVNLHRSKALRARLLEGSRNPLLLYVPTSFRGPQRYFGEGASSDVAYFELQQRILRCCAEFPDVRVIYKEFPGGGDAVDPIPEFLARCVPNARIVSTPLTELIWAVDAIVIDWPSTALTEAVLTDKPLLVYAGRDWARLVPIAKSALQQRAWVSETPDAFETHVRAFLSADDFSPVTSQGEEFLELVGVRQRGPRSAERAAQAIEEAAIGLSLRVRTENSCERPPIDVMWSR